MAGRQHYISRKLLQRYLEWDAEQVEPTNLPRHTLFVSRPGSGKVTFSSYAARGRLRSAVAPRPRGERLMAGLLPTHLQDAILGDLAQEFEQVRKECGRLQAERRWWRELIRSAGPSLCTQFWLHLRRRFGR